MLGREPGWSRENPWDPVARRREQRAILAGALGAPPSSAAPIDATFAFVDLAGYTALTEAHGDQGAATITKAFYALAQSSLAGDTRIVKLIGDAVMLVSTSPAACVETLLAMYAHAEKLADFPDLRAGVEVGQSVQRGDDYFGSTVNLASRITSHARAGEILCGPALAKMLSLDDTTALPGQVRLKNITQPVPLYLLHVRSGQTTSGEIDPVCRMRVPSPAATTTYEGRTYAFCSKECARRFLEAPASYVPPEA